MQTRARKARRLMAFFNAVAKPFAVWAWIARAARKAIGTGPTICTPELIRTLAPVPAAAQRWPESQIAVIAPAEPGPKLLEIAAIPEPEATAEVAQPCEVQNTADAEPDAAAPVVGETSEPMYCSADRASEFDSFATEPEFAEPATEISAVALDAEPTVAVAPEVETTADVQIDRHAIELAQSIIAADSGDCPTFDGEAKLATVVETELEPNADDSTKGHRADFRLAARMAIVGTMNAPASRASKRTRQVAPAGRAVPVQKPVTLKVRKSDKPPSALPNGMRKVRASAEIIELASVRDAPNANRQRRAA